MTLITSTFKSRFRSLALVFTWQLVNRAMTVIGTQRMNDASDEISPPPYPPRSPPPAIRFGRIPQSEKQRLKVEFGMGGRSEAEQTLTPPDHKVLVQQIHQAYMRNFSMNNDRARLILTGKTSRPVRGLGGESR